MTTVLVPRFEAGRAMLMGGLRGFHHFATAADTIPAQWTRFRAQLPPPGLRRPSVSYGIVCQTDRAKGTFEYMCAHEVTDLSTLPLGLGRLRVPMARYAVFRHEGHISTLPDTWTAIWQQWYPTSGQQWAPTPDFERYGPEYDFKTGLGGVEIWFPVFQAPEPLPGKM